MQADAFSLSKYPFLSDIIKDFVEDKTNLRPFHSGAASMDGLLERARTRSIDPAIREDLCNVLRAQYSSLDPGASVSKNLELLASDSTKVVVTGHQICLLSGPVFSLLKIASVINLALQLTRQQPEFPVVPVFWMATEDHDFEEVNHVFIKGQKHTWETNQEGAVGRMKVNSIGDFLKDVESQLSPNVVASELWSKTKQAYAAGSFADAARQLFHHLFGDFGLIVLDADHPDLKRHFVPFVKRDISENFSHQAVESTSQNLQELGYKTQVTAREINLFYISKDVRSRFSREQTEFNREQASLFELVGQDRQWTLEELQEEIDNHPERFSPNVVLRPLYQEVILPNIAYVGGPGELAYWLQLKGVFENSDTPMPALVLRQMAYFIPGFIEKKVNKSSHGFEAWLKGKDAIVREVVSDEAVELADERKSIEEAYNSMSDKLETIDPALKSTVQAELAKAMKGIGNVESRMARSIKRKNEEQLNRLESIDRFLFPGGGPHERRLNWFEILSWFDPELMSFLVEKSNPLKKEVIAFKPY